MLTSKQRAFLRGLANTIPATQQIGKEGVTENHGTGGFGYDPVFWVPEEKESFSSMPQERKNQISHRANALALTKEELEKRGL